MTDKPIHLVPLSSRISKEYEREWNETYAFKANLATMREVRRQAYAKQARRQSIYSGIAICAALAFMLALSFI